MAAKRPAAPADRPFGNPVVEPSEEALELALGDAIGRFDIIRGLAVDFDSDWAFYRGSGWMLKIHDAKKALLYLIPLRGSFRLSMAIREAERADLAADAGLAALRPTLEAARKVPEGYAVAFDVDAAGDFGPIRSFVEKLIRARERA